MRNRMVLSLYKYAALALLSLPSFAGPVADDRLLVGSGYHTGISPGLELLIDQSIKAHHGKEKLTLLDSEIQKDPTNTSLLFKKAAFYADQGDWKHTIEVLDQISLLQPNNAKANKLRKIVEAKLAALPHHEVGIDTDEAYVSDLHAYWNYTAVHYYRLTQVGKFGGHLNYAQRYGTTGKQYQLEAYPIFNDKLSATFSFAYSNTTQYLFPNLQYIVEVYLGLPQGFEMSVGQTANKFIRFSNQKIINYTGTLGKYIGNSYVWFRPSYYTPKHVAFYQLGARHYFSDAMNYISLIAGAGTLPDIGNLPPLDQMIIMNQRGIGIAGQFALSHTMYLKYGTGLVKQRYPSGLHRRISDASVGIMWEL